LTRSEIPAMLRPEEYRSRWGARASNPLEGAQASSVGSTPASSAPPSFVISNDLQENIVKTSPDFLIKEPRSIRCYDIWFARTDVAQRWSRLPKPQADATDASAAAPGPPEALDLETPKGADLEEVYDSERHLLYVASTRDHLLVTGVKPASEFLDDVMA
jgi:hypothetical protein